MEAFLAGMAILADPFALFMIVAGTVIGITVGALPGISGSTTIALMLPITLGLDPVVSLAFLGSIYCAANFGGSITAILVNAPGDPSASATALEGYKMAERGEAGMALGMSAVASAIGGIFSVVVMIVAAPLLSRAAYSFGPPEYLALALFGLSMCAAVGGDSAVKNLIAATFGVLLATVGIDLTTGVERYTFGFYDLTDGVSFVAALIGLFAVGEMLDQATQQMGKPTLLKMDAVRVPGRAEFRKCNRSIWLGSVIGTFIGILPALGATAAALIGYNETRRWSKHKHEFGHGSIEGVAGPEAANNAAVGGGMVPTLALGIPGSATTAIILAGLIVQGVRPGPHLFNEQPRLLYAVFASMLAANILYLVIGLGAAKLFARISLIPAALLWPAVFVLSVIGAYGANQSMGDVWLMMAFGILGFAFRRTGFSPAPLIMGLVLGSMVEESLKQSILIFGDDVVGGFIGRPIALVLFAITALGLLVPPVLRATARLRQPQAREV
ncbi:tripartite tricarboxylate transporter permease [Teichococcus vastitatis]|jgi:putative tricarboxylic transport membrane protein|uniref:Tripartite tricarboxylate transporter permease n=1 Tax=Teichococcus vastitatis TaxID=2307076 RepID=A0ABS9W7U7_9PROT|nr:tripartite tricarboxylate transporter permease [Pseudoroseomonas vastitatis]MCI0755373.1 tripartite tricarboxylate transporter permease [Pseudoroseomonas vastitatis]